MITISFYSYKGGVGRSLALTNLGVYLAQFGATVVMVDFDLEAPGLHYKIQPGSRIAVESRGLAGLLADTSRGRPLPESAWDLTIDVSEHADVSQPNADMGVARGSLFLLPAGDPLRADYWADLATIDWELLFAAGSRPGVLVLEELRNRLIATHKPDVLLVDSRTGITPGGGVATTLLPDVVVAMLLNTREHIDGTRMVVAAVTGAGGAESPPPRVIPVLSRYTGRPRLGIQTGDSLRTHRAAMERVAFEVDEQAEFDALGALRRSVVEGLDAASLARVGTPLLLHTDLALQQLERLTFGPYAGAADEDSTDTLFEDYVQLFAALVPQDVFLRYLGGMRSRAREILLDRPDDAVRTLESLAALVDDEAVFIDLMKAYVLRRDAAGMLRAAERLYRVHHRIIVHEALTKALRDRAIGRRPPREMHSVSLEFAKAYWMQAAPDDAQWGSSVVRQLADAGKANQAEKCASALIARSPSAETLESLVATAAQGNSEAEAVAVKLALENFELGSDSAAFVRAAAVACRYQPTHALADKILESTRSDELPTVDVVSLLLAADRPDEAARLLVSTLASLNPDVDDVDDYLKSWQVLSRRNRALRGELELANPATLQALDTYGPRGAENAERYGRQVRVR